MQKKKTTLVAVVGVALFVVMAIVGIGSVLGGGSQVEKPTFDDYGEVVSGADLTTLADGLKYTTAELVKAPVEAGSTSSLYDELPEIDKYPLAVQGTGVVDIEIFTSGEKAGKNTDGWLIEVAQDFNRSGAKTANGASISMSVRSVPSGTAADYVISMKALPDLWTPSNEMFGEYAMVNGAPVQLYQARTVGNVAGILVKKDATYTSAQAVVDMVTSGSYNLGYTNPQTSATGLNLLVQLLKDFGNDDITSEAAADTFSKFNNNIPFIAYTTQQMRDSATSGSLDGMVTEYQAYINDDSLKAQYKFIPFGMRHDNPLYLVSPSSKSPDELEAIDTIYRYMMSASSQNLATRYGFNANDDYQSSYTTTGAEISQALEIYKSEKDAGRDIIAVFVADCSGSMDGEPMLQLKQSLSNGMQYINDNNYVGLVSYSSDVVKEVPIAKFDFTQKSYFQGAINRLSANGMTSTYEAMVVALKMIEEAKVDHPDAKCMMFLLSDGQANGHYSLDDISYAMKTSQVPVYTIGYTNSADTAELARVSGINEAASISADADDVVYKIKTLFNAQL